MQARDGESRWFLHRAGPETPRACVTGPRRFWRTGCETGLSMTAEDRLCQAGRIHRGTGAESQCVSYTLEIREVGGGRDAVPSDSLPAGESACRNWYG